MQSTSLDAYKSIDLSRQEKIILGALATLEVVPQTARLRNTRAGRPARYRVA